jgi:hypothetical protein
MERGSSANTGGDVPSEHLTEQTDSNGLFILAKQIRFNPLNLFIL